MSNLQWDEIVAQFHAKRAVEVACVGDHHLFLLGVNTSQAEDLAAWARDHGASHTTASLPCPCGWHGDAKRELCTCDYEAIGAYQEAHFPAVVDIWLELPSIREQDTLAHKQHGGQPWSAVEDRILAARVRMDDPAYQSYAIDDAGKSLVNTVVRQLGLSQAAKDNLLDLARTIATLAGDTAVRTPHLAEAAQYQGRR